jgi:hypothetical protein
MSSEAEGGGVEEARCGHRARKSIRLGVGGFNFSSQVISRVARNANYSVGRFGDTAESLPVQSSKVEGWSLRCGVPVRQMPAESIRQCRTALRWRCRAVSARSAGRREANDGFLLR